jgi:aminomuconate-semialdehyde/2-hydroxymuconate-6-semialdehyde dehydrogenase
MVHAAIGIGVLCLGVSTVERMTQSEPARVRNVVADATYDGVGTFEKVSPVDGTVAAIVHEAGAELVDSAVQAARAAVEGPWANSSVAERVALLRRIADGIDARFEEFVAAEVRDTGKPVSLVRELDVPRAAANFRAFADTIAAAGVDSTIADLPGGAQALNYAVRKPIGVVAVIVPWNLPLLLLTWKVAPALGCGNAVVVKPSEESPSTATLLAEVIRDAGAPAGLYNVVHGFGAGSAGEHLTQHPGIDAVTFTGETSTGAAIMRAAAPRVRPVSFELGGKNAAIVFDDADLDATVNGLARSVFLNSGQVCLCTERVYVQRGVFDGVVEGLKRKAEEFVLGRPEDPATNFGPLISRTHLDKVSSYVALAEQEGAELVTGGRTPDLGAELAGGSWMEPTLWVGLDNSARVLREEIFGPVAAIVPFDSEDEAIKLANDTDYGLAASIWTQNLQRGHRVAQAMNVGIAWVNTWYTRDLRSPFGGSGLSGIGREGGHHSLNFYSEPTNVCIQL